NNQILARGDASAEFKGMGTTSTVLLLLPHGALLAHVGDSRAYRVRDGQIDQLTFDHSLVWELKASGKKFQQKCSTLVGKNIITRSLGPNPRVNVDIEGPHPCKPGDVFLLCSDGLSGQVEDNEIGAVLLSLPLAEAVQSLVNLANLRGGPDNITMVAVRVLGPQIAAQPQKQNAKTNSEKHFSQAALLAWLVMLIALCGAGGMWLLEKTIPAVVLLLVAVLSGLFALTRSFSRSNTESVLLTDRHYGRGPYVRCPCAPNEEFIHKLNDIIAQLREAAEHENWTIDWQVFDQYIKDAETARNSNDILSCSRQTLRAISFLMAELKKQSPHSTKTN
ncbi:MAG: PP2C family protein-serine/threonine phosphatase, partial [Thermoguttaceae bacterium]